MLTQEQLKACLTYDPLKGAFHWLISQGTASAGSKAGYLDAYGRRKIGVGKKYYAASRLAFLYMTGKFPLYEVDHINRVRLDDRWVNLRDVPSQVNNKNKGLYVNNSSGYPGVRKRNDSGKWLAQIGTTPRTYLGTYETFEEAKAARVEAEHRLLHYSKGTEDD